jgi:hypothetical protein
MHKKIAVYVCVGLILFANASVFAQSCDEIKGQDEQNYCRSIVTGERKFCKKINNNDTKNLCLAKIENNLNLCKKIENPKIRKRCQDSIR